MYDAESSQLEAQKWNWSKPEAVKLQFQGTSMRHVLARLQTDHGLAGGSAERRRGAKEAGNISMPVYGHVALRRSMGYINQTER